MTWLLETKGHVVANNSKVLCLKSNLCQAFSMPCEHVVRNHTKGKQAGPVCCQVGKTYLGSDVACNLDTSHQCSHVRAIICEVAQVNLRAGSRHSNTHVNRWTGHVLGTLGASGAACDLSKPTPGRTHAPRQSSACDRSIWTVCTCVLALMVLHLRGGSQEHEAALVANQAASAAFFRNKAG